MSPILRAKLRTPALPAHHVHRERLCTHLEELVDSSIVLVVAPAGTGKTQLLASWAAVTDRATAWLSLDESDGDATSLWSGVVAALNDVAPGCGARAMRRLRTASDPCDAVAALLDDLDGWSGREAVLVLDDFHTVDRAPGVDASMSLFLQHLPPSLHVVVASRQLPHLPLDRLRARGHLGQLGFGELCFSTAESRALLASLVPWLSDDVVDRFVERADGWAASLQLAALAARSAQARGDAAALDPGDELVADYVWSEVLVSEPPGLVDVLRDLSVVERVNANLGHALTDRADIADRLLEAESAGVFVMRVGREGWYQVHSVLRSLLLAELAERDPARLRALRARAARWMEDAGDVVHALDYWIAAERPDEALRLLAASNRELYDSHRESVIADTLALIPASVANADLTSMLDYAWCHIAVDMKRFGEVVRHAAWWAATTADVPATAQLHLTMLQSMAATASGDWETGGALADAALARAADGWAHDRLASFGWNLVARKHAYGERWDETAPEVSDAVHSLERDPARRVAFDGTRSLGAALAGRPIDALRIAAGVRGATEVAHLSITRHELATAEAIAAREIGDRVDAITALEKLAATPSRMMSICRLLATVELVHARLDDGDVDAASVELERARRLSESEELTAGARSWIARAAVALALARGSIDEARHDLAGVDDDFWGPVCAARIDLADNAPERAVAKLATAQPRCPRHDVVLELVSARAAADDVIATKHVCAAIDAASRHGMLQTAASDCADIMELVEREAMRVPELWMQRLRQRVAESGRRVPAELHSFGQQLTERERDVLRFLPSRLTVKEIADELYLSVNTLKFHLKVIYRKLGVRSRAEAADAARRMMTTRR